MQKLLLLVLLVSTLQIGSSQCDIPFGDFEIWDDFTVELNDGYDIMLADSTIILPTTTLPIFRLFFLDDIEEIIGTNDVEDLNIQIAGLDRSTESRTGNYALKLGGATNDGFSDMFHVGGCDAMFDASTISFYYKHFGENNDSLFLTVNTGPVGEDIVDFTGEIDSSAVFQNATVLLEIAGEVNAEWQWFQLPLNSINVDLSSDSLFVHMFRVGKPAADHYWLIDDFQWNIETPTVDINNEFIFQLGLSMDSKTIFPRLDHERFTFVEYKMFDGSGRNVENANSEWNDVISVEHLPKGQYYFQIITDQGTYAKPFVRF